KELRIELRRVTIGCASFARGNPGSAWRSASSNRPETLRRCNDPHQIRGVQRCAKLPPRGDPFLVVRGLSCGSGKVCQQRFAHCNRRDDYSITSSARASNDSGTESPIALAAFRLITNWYLVGSCNGSSAGFAPRKIRST